MVRDTKRQAKLADEIMESQKTRSDLLKWKLFICAVLGAAGLGFAKDATSSSIALLALIPLACLYVDLLCTNINIRIIVIGSYFAEVTQDRYEQFVGKRRIAFSLEDWALYGSTYVISALLICSSMIFLSLRIYRHYQNLKNIDSIVSLAECVAVMATASLAIWLTHMTIKAFHLALSHKKFEDKKNLGQAFVEELTEIKVVRWMMNKMFALERKKKDELISDYLKKRYERKDAVELYDFLVSQGTFDFKRFDNGLFSAIAKTEGDHSGYQYVWVRDNVHIAHAHYQWGDIKKAVQTARSLMFFFQSQRRRMKAIIQDPSMASDPMNRPHIRFNGKLLKELEQKWNHAQNDALGYFLWFYCRLAKDNQVPWTEGEQACLTRLALYLQAIRYWEDKDSGHWEEVHKVSASSIGAVVAGLREFSALSNSGEVDLLNLRAKGETALSKILPYESKPSRRYDASLLFLIYPLRVVSQDQARVILKDVKTHLQGSIGIKRYLNDSYWCADYRNIFKAKERTQDFSDNMTSRDAHLKPGQEAQWCIFDPIISCIYADQPSLIGNEKNGQIDHLNRSLRQLAEYSDGRLLCPEAYFLEDDQYTPNDHIPLQWTQANLRLAIHFLINPIIE